MRKEGLPNFIIFVAILYLILNSNLYNIDGPVSVHRQVYGMYGCICVCVCVCVYMTVLCVQTDLKDIAELVPDHLNNINITILTLYYSLHYVYKVHTLIFKYFIVIKTLTII